MMIVIAGPSGVGKGTVIKQLRQRNPELKLAISCTTRPPRPGETHGQDYYFLSEQEFDQQDLLESAIVHGFRYGTPNEAYDQDVIFEVDVQGARALKASRPDCVTIFLAPPSWAELEKRLIGRQTETADIIKKRLQTASQELTKQQEHDYNIVNDQLIQTVLKIEQIIGQEKRAR